MLLHYFLAPRFKGTAHVVLGHVGVELRRARIFVPQCSLHNVERVAVLGSRGAALSDCTIG